MCRYRGHLNPSDHGNLGVVNRSARMGVTIGIIACGDADVNVITGYGGGGSRRNDITGNHFGGGAPCC